MTGFELTVAVMKEEDAWDKAQLPGKSEHLLSLSRMACAENTANDHSKTRILAEPLKAFLQIGQNFLRCVISLDSINRNLHFLKPRFIESFDQLRPQQEAVGDHTCAKETKFPARADQAGELRVQRGLATR